MLRVHLGPFVFGPNTNVSRPARIPDVHYLGVRRVLVRRDLLHQEAGGQDGAAAEDHRRMFGALLLMIAGIIPEIGSAWPIPALSCAPAPNGITFNEFKAGFRHKGAL